MAENEKTGINAKGVLYIVAAAFFWGIMPMFAKLALNSGADGLTSAVMRAYVAAVLYIAYGLITGAFKRFSPRHILFFCSTASARSRCCTSAISRRSNTSRRPWRRRWFTPLRAS